MSEPIANFITELGVIVSRKWEPPVQADTDVASCADQQHLNTCFRMLRAVMLYMTKEVSCRMLT